VNKVNTDKGSDDLQLRIREIDNGYLVMSGDSQFYCYLIEDVISRIDSLLMLRDKKG